MTEVRENLNELSEWKALEEHAARAKRFTLRRLFADDPRRAEQFSLGACGLLLDYSKNWIDKDTLRLLLDLAEAPQIGLRRAIEAMFSGETINRTEGRAVLHIALRNCSGRPIVVDGENVMQQVRGNEGVLPVLRKMRQFAYQIRTGRYRGVAGQMIRNIVNIGIGGSDLGPAMAYDALRPYTDRRLTVRFVSNIDAAHLCEALRGLDPRETLFIVCSKTFTTLETMTNATAAMEWLLAAYAGKSSEECVNIVRQHFVAVTAARQAILDPDGLRTPLEVFRFWDWVGGRYSLCSAVGLALMIAVGPENFDRLLGGYHQMDEHFRQAPFAENMPVILALLGIWYNNFFGLQTYAVLPYAQGLHRFPAYLQQLDMESNGKQARLLCNPEGNEDELFVQWQTGPILWGEPGTNGQHAFFQLLHQGRKIVPADFIGFAQTNYPEGDHHAKLLANLLAQTEALAIGKTRQEVEAELQAKHGSVDPAQVPHRMFPGNRPTNTILGQKLDPETLGKLIALYEHKVFVQGVIWDINSFDQFGVELGKQLAGQLLPAMQDAQAPIPSDNPSTVRLIQWIRRHQATAAAEDAT